MCMPENVDDCFDSEDGGIKNNSQVSRIGTWANGSVVSHSKGQKEITGACVGLLCLAVQSCPTLQDPMDCSPPGSSVHEDSPGENTGVGCHASSRGSSQPRDQTRVSRIAGGFFTVWATREAQEYWSG